MHGSTFLAALAVITFIVSALCYFSLEISESKERVRRRVELFALGRDSVTGVVGATGLARPGRSPAGIVATPLRGNELEFARQLEPLHIRPELAVGLLWALRSALAAAMALGVVWLTYRYPRLQGRGLLGLLLAGLAVGWFTPTLFLRHLAIHRTRAIARGLPDAIELLAVAVEAGLSLEEAMNRIVVELSASQPIMAKELAVTCADLRVLPDRGDALHRLAERINLPSVHSVVTTLSQTLRYGTPLAKALRVVASELRNDALLKLEERANRLPVFLTIPLILFILPSLILIIGGPAGLRIWDVFIHWN